MRTSRRLVVVALAAQGWAGSAWVSGAVFTWTGGGASANWSVGGNWVGAAAPASATTTEVEFGAAAGLWPQPLQNVGNPMTLNKLRFASGAAPFAIGGSPIKFDGTNAGFEQNSATAETVKATIVLPTTNTNYVFGGTGTGDVAIAGPVSGSGILVKTGPYKLTINDTFTASSDQSNAMSVEGGTFALGASNLMAPSIELLIGTSGGTGTFDLNGKSQTLAMAFMGPNATIRMGGGTLTLTSGAGTGGGSIRNLVGAGSLIKGPGSTQFVGASPSFTGSITVQSGATVFVQADGSLGDATGTTVVEDGGCVHLNNVNYTTAEPITLKGFGQGTSQLRVDTGSLAGPVKLAADASIGSIGGTFTFTGGIDTGAAHTVQFGDFGSGVIVVANKGITGTGGVHKRITTGERLAINADSTYTGDTWVERGILDVNATLSQTPTIHVDSLGTLRGNGNAPSAALTLAGSFQPGIGVGKFSAKSATLVAGGSYQWQVQDAAGLPGVGYDVLELSGALSDPETSGVFTIVLSSINGAGGGAPAANFNSNNAYAWRLIGAGSLDPNLTLSDLALNASGFTTQNPTNGGLLALSLESGGLYLRFTPVPEPVAALAFIPGIAAVLGRRRR